MTERVNENNQIIITKELLLHLGSCGISFDRPNQKNYDPTKDDSSADDHYFTVANMWGRTEIECIEFLIDNNLSRDLAWYIEQRKTEKFVRYIGKVFSMGKYQVFNTLTGTHQYCDTEEEAKIALTEIAKAIIATHSLTICRELTNEYGHTTWISSELPNPFTITPNT